uniref:Copia protein n=1 Tax=Tanacetum cinerariifolium TaxID=118510 RepID=A0A699GYG1_TANCI|nr:copia protein [Tanacetum cinerariifolium]
MVDNTLFTKKKSSNLIIVQIYVNDIIFGSTCQDMCDEFTKSMDDEFEMSMMGELNFFLRLQIKQMKDGCCLKSWFSKKQTTLVISTTEVEYRLIDEDPITSHEFRIESPQTNHYRIDANGRLPPLETLKLLVSQDGASIMDQRFLESIESVDSEWK